MSMIQSNIGYASDVFLFLSMRMARLAFPHSSVAYAPSGACLCPFHNSLYQDLLMSSSSHGDVVVVVLGLY